MSDLLMGLSSFFVRSQSCSAESHYFTYAIFAQAVFWSAVGVFVWRRFIRTQPGASSSDLMRSTSLRASADGVAGNGNGSSSGGFGALVDCGR